ncbi:MAG: DNA polymerase III subunit gamma/tau, partial [Lachnospiraceae bacterium]|nr:DNA polymerase III subunit gamma/tau [Lachnospiraceae bacterium]
DGPCGNCASCREILAGNSMDVLELDAASNNSVEDVHTLIKAAQYVPVHKKKVFILDEVHMLSTAAFNAMLKTIEEPNENTLFIFCTTEEHKVPATIKSRCMRIVFERIHENVIYEYLKEVCEMPKYQTTYDEDALKLIARESGGSMRDALSILDPFLNRGKVEAEEVAEYLGIAWEENLFTVLDGIANQDMPMALSAFRDIIRHGGNAKNFVKGLMQACIDLIYAEDEKRIEDIVCTKLYKAYLQNMAGHFTNDRLLYMVDELSKIYGNAKYTSIEFAAETTIISLMASETTISKMAEEIEVLKKEVALLKKQGINQVSMTSLPVDNESEETLAEAEAITEKTIQEEAEPSDWQEEEFAMYADMAGSEEERSVWEVAGAEALGSAFPDMNGSSLAEEATYLETKEEPISSQVMENITEEVPEKDETQQKQDLTEEIRQQEEMQVQNPVPAECLPAGAIIGNDILLNMETKETEEVIKDQTQDMKGEGAEEEDDEDDMFFDFFRNASLARH